MLKTSVPGYFKARRERLAQAAPDSVFILPANPMLYRNSNVEYPHRQDSSFYYLCGFEEPEATLVITTAQSKSGSHRSILFVRDKNPEREMWEGERYGAQAAQKAFGVDEAYSTQDFDSKMIEILKSGSRVFYRVGKYESLDRRIFDLLEKTRLSLGRTGKSVPPIGDPDSILGELRLFKNPEEVECMRRAGHASALAHRAAMEQVKPGMTEHEVWALLDYVYRKNGCKREAYGAIVGGGRNATCLHYRENDQPLRDGDLLLIDAAGEYEYYNADITRTFPVGKKFSAAQTKIYDLVLKAQLAAIQLAKPGTRYSEFHRVTTDIITDGLLSLGILKGKKDEILKSQGYKRFFPHGTGHFLGMDVHDVGLYADSAGESRIVEPGMVFTIEPGIYFQPTDSGFPAEYQNIGIRIEDDIFITPDGCEILSREVPKTREEIEALRAKSG
jgi:Xaa-Pro aminopeptidase